MAVIEGGVSAALAGVGAEAANPLHTTAKPIPYGALGHYRVARRLAPAASTTAGILWALRNPSASGKLVVVTRVRLRGVQIAAPTAAIEDQFRLVVERAYTVADTTGSADVHPAASMQKLRTSMADAVAQVRESNAAGGATGGTKTPDTDALATGSMWVSAAVAGTGLQPPVDVIDYYPKIEAGEHPLILASDEGFAVRNENSFGTASGIILHIELSWAETLPTGY